MQFIFYFNPRFLFSQEFQIGQLDISRLFRAYVLIADIKRCNSLDVFYSLPIDVGHFCYLNNVGILLFLCFRKTEMLDLGKDWWLTMPMRGRYCTEFCDSPEMNELHTLLDGKRPISSNKRCVLI